MLTTDRNALECDLAETYHIYDIDSLPVSKVAMFAAGLRANSRIKMLMSGDRIDLNTTLMAGIYDHLAWLKWARTEDGMNNINHPKSILSLLIGEKDAGKHMTFRTAEEFERAFSS